MKDISWYLGLEPPERYAGHLDEALVKLSDVQPKYEFITFDLPRSAAPFGRQKKASEKGTPHLVINEHELRSVDAAARDCHHMYDTDKKFFIALGGLLAGDSSRGARIVKDIFRVYPTMTDAAYAIENESAGDYLLRTSLYIIGQDSALFTYTRETAETKVDHPSFLPTHEYPAVSLPPKDGTASIVLFHPNEADALQEKRNLQLAVLRQLFYKDLIKETMPTWIHKYQDDIVRAASKSANVEELEAMMAVIKTYGDLFECLPVDVI